MHVKTTNPLFIWIPKTGGTSVFNAFREKDPEFLKNKYHREKLAHKLKKGTHGHSYVRAIYTDEELENFYKFTVVRNPYTRLVSLFFYYLKRRRDYEFRKSNKMENFKLFAMHVLEHGLNEKVNMGQRGHCIQGENLYISPIQPQNAWITGVNNVKVYKMETLNELFQDFELEPRKDNSISGVERRALEMAFLGTPKFHNWFWHDAPKPSITALAPGGFRDYKHYYDQELFDKVNEFYREDFESFGYKMRQDINEDFDSV